MLLSRLGLAFSSTVTPTPAAVFTSPKKVLLRIKENGCAAGGSPAGSGSPLTRTPPVTLLKKMLFSISTLGTTPVVFRTGRFRGPC